ncbi:MAG: type I phosphomannose isomerase catalytic subunit [Erysipelotrichaceae bacterium]
MSILFFEPIPRAAIWGKTVVKEYFGYEQYPYGIGQSWSFSAQNNASNICLSEPFKGATLAYLWHNHPELFNSDYQDFPVIISLVGPEDDLSIQVHPDDLIAKKHGYLSGKNEAWYFIEAEDNYNIVYSHNAKNEKELREYIEAEKWDDLINHLDVSPKDFVYLPAGLLHALRKGSIVYEIQQAVDVTYRFYDYHRKDDKGQERELHLEKAIECLSYGDFTNENYIEPIIIDKGEYKETTFINNNFFTVKKLEINGVCDFKSDKYQLATVIKGTGFADDIGIKIGDSFLIPVQEKVKLVGTFEVMLTTK